MLCTNCQTKLPTTKARLQKVNSKLTDLGKTYWDNMSKAFAAVDTALVSQGFEETNGCTETAGTATSFHGNAGEGKWVHISWHRMESGRYELVAYVN